MSRIYNTLVMEIRPLLQSCNVHLVFKHEFKGRNRVKLLSDEIQLKFDDIHETIKVDEFNILPNSFVCLKSTENYLSFRFQTTNLDQLSGLFKYEFLPFANCSDHQSKQTDDLKLATNLNYTIKCSKCQQKLSEQLAFTRILPLPSENLEPNEFFCHKPAETELNLTPQPLDLFYSLCHFHINESNVINIEKSDFISCAKCRAWLGIVVKSGAIQFWYHTVDVVSDKHTIRSDPLRDLRALLKSNLINPQLTNKFLLECSNSNYLLLWLLENQLQLCRIDGVDSLKRMFYVSKVLYRLEVKNSQLCNGWLNDMMVTHMKISQPMMDSCLAHLNEMQELIPECYRKSNEFNISYFKK